MPDPQVPFGLRGGWKLLDIMPDRNTEMWYPNHTSSIWLFVPVRIIFNELIIQRKLQQNNKETIDF